jgi:hypothetical protein
MKAPNSFVKISAGLIGRGDGFGYEDGGGYGYDGGGYGDGGYGDGGYGGYGK